MHIDVAVLAGIKANGDIIPWFVDLPIYGGKQQLKVDSYTCTERNYAANPTLEFECKLENGLEITLIYFIKNHQWKLKNPNRKG